MTEERPLAEREREMIVEARAEGNAALLSVFTKLSGPGWLQAAITLGGGSLAGSLYLGVLGGYSLLWLQVLAMAMGVIMLSAIGYVTLSTGERPFRAINEHINPVLGWGWALATFSANIVWCLPQFSLGTAAIQQNLLPGLDNDTGKAIICIAILVITAGITLSYDSGSRGIKIYENVLRIVVGAIVVSFFGVVIKLSASDTGGMFSWGAIAKGFVPDLSLLKEPAAGFDSALAATGEYAKFWSDMIVAMQRDVMITAAATAVGINMTFLLPYSLLAKGWDREFRGLAIFDLATGMAVPFVIATGCVVIASATQFHAQPAPGLLGEVDSSGAKIEPAPNLVGPFNGLLETRAKAEAGDEWDQLSDDEKEQRKQALPEADKKMAAMLVKRDAKNLADALQPLTGRVFANYIFGFGVLAMSLSTITILMLISGFTVCEMLGLPPKGKAHRIGAMAPALGVLGPFYWSDAAVWLAVPTSVFGMMLLPIAYGTFFLMMNNKKILGDAMPQGGRRVRWNVLMFIAFALSSYGAGWSVWSKTKWYGVAMVAGFLVLALVVQIARTSKPSTPSESV